MPGEETDSGLEDTSIMSNEGSPTGTKTEDHPPVVDEAGDTVSLSRNPAQSLPQPLPPLGSRRDEDEDIDETLSERLWALTEMFPESLRNGVSKLSWGTVWGVKWLYGFTRSATWVVCTSSLVLVAPVIFEMERSQMEEMQRQQQRQILLGPGKAMSGGGPGMMPPPPQR